MRGIAITVVTLIAGTFCATSAAQPANVLFDSWAASEQAAYATWGHPWCGQAIFLRVPDADLEGWAAEAEPIQCMVKYGSRALRMEPDELCPLIVHEVGHIFGIGHTSPEPVMQPGLADYTEVPECAKRIRLRWVQAAQRVNGRWHVRCRALWTDATIDTSPAWSWECPDNDNITMDMGGILRPVKAR